jgi:hypothetical protein
MTFIVTDTDVINEKDPRANTSELATAMTTFHKDTTWHDTDEWKLNLRRMLGD